MGMAERHSGALTPWLNPTCTLSPAGPCACCGGTQPHAEVSGWGRPGSPGWQLAVLGAGAAVRAGPRGRQLTDSVPLRCTCRGYTVPSDSVLRSPKTPGSDFNHHKPQSGTAAWKTRWPPAVCTCLASTPPWGEAARFSPETQSPQPLCLCLGAGTDGFPTSLPGLTMGPGWTVNLTTMNCLRDGPVTQAMSVTRNVKVMFWLLKK